MLATFGFGAGSIEHIPTDSRVYDDIDLLKVSGLIRSMPSISRPWTRAEAAFLVKEAVANSTAAMTNGEQAALARLRYEFGYELGELGRRPLVAIPVPEDKDDFAYGDLFTRIGAVQERSNDSLYLPVPYFRQRTASLGAVIGNRPGDRFIFYERGAITFFHPFRGDTWDSSGLHLPRSRAAAFHELLAFEIEHAYLAFRAPWVRLEFGRDRLFWGPGYLSSVLLSDHAPSLDLAQVSASFPNFKFVGFTSYLSRWNYIHRFLSAQRVEFSLFNRVTLGAAMMNVYSWDSLLLAPIAGFMNPLLPGYVEAANTHHTSNLLVGFDGVLYLRRVKLYGQVNFD
ncbi:MAG: capsule assembly Wzi family protein, partial [candidate division WOR-3 bacterium]